MSGTLDELTREQCWALLAGQPVGRVVYTDGALPACGPVRFAVQGDALVFRAPSESRLAAATHAVVVAFEADAIDPLTMTGWCVLVTGLASPVEDAGTRERRERRERLERLDLVPRVAGQGSTWLRLVPRLVSGRVLTEEPSPEPVTVPAPLTGDALLTGEVLLASQA